MYYPHSFLERVRQACDIVSLIGEDTALKARGDRFTGLCPFPGHNEKTPSFSISQSKQLYYCFGCGNSGNIWTYLQKQRGMDFPSAVAYLSRKAGLTPPKPSSLKRAPPSLDETSSLFQLNEKVCRFYESCLGRLPSTHPAKLYLRKRGWSKQAVKNFRLGYAQEGALTGFLSLRERALAERLGLLSLSKGGKRYESFRRRLIFPLISVRRQVMGFGARVLDDSLPKYINSKESPIFHKGQSFYGLHESARFIREKAVALIVEGYTDFLSLREAGFLNVTAVLGTALTENHALVLKRYAETAVLVFDGDQAGFKACERSLPALLGAGLEVKFVSLPFGQDPDEFIGKNGKEAFQIHIRKARDLFLFLMGKKQKELKAEGRQAFHLIEEMAPLLLAVRHPILRELYKNRLLDIFGTEALIMEKALKDTVRRLVKKSQKRDKPPSGKVLEQAQALPPAGANALSAERWLLALCLEDETFFRQFLSEDRKQLLKTPVVARIFDEAEKHHRKDSSDFSGLIHLAINVSDDPALIFGPEFNALHSADSERRRRLFKDCIQHLKNRGKKQQAAQWIERIKKGDGAGIHHLEKVFQLTRQRLKAGRRG